MRETPADLERLQALLDRSYETAGPHLREVITDERRLSAPQLCARLESMCLLVLATVTADGRPISGAVDGFFYRGAWYFGSSRDSVRMRHIAQRPGVSATYAPAEELSVTTHGRAVPVDLASHDGGGLKRLLVEDYAARHGPEAVSWLDVPGLAYARIDAQRMFTFHLALDEGAEREPAEERDTGGEGSASRS
jgi:hypothetical protein